MYNDEMKSAFLGTIANDNSYKAHLRVFRSIEDMENRYEKDVCEMSVEELLTVLDLKTGTRTTNTIQFMSLLRSYVDWCLQTGKVIGENNLDKIDFKEVDRTKNVRDVYIGSVGEFENMCKVVYEKNMTYNETIEIPKELIVRLCFEGMENTEIVLMKKDMIDETNRVIKSPLYPDIEYHVSKHIINLCRYCIEQKEVMYSAPSRGTELRMERVADSDYVIRPRISALRRKPETTPMSEVNILRKVNEFSKRYYEETEYYKDLTPNKIRESALMIQIHNSKNPAQFIENEVRIDLELRNPNISKNRINEKIKRIRELYSIWSETFF